MIQRREKIIKNNKNLTAAKVQCQDEYYTILSDIEKEILNHVEYIDFLNGKSVYLPCDNPVKSQFAGFFFNHFIDLKLKKLVCTHLSHEEKQSFATVIQRNDNENICITFEPINGNGDFRSDDCVKYMRECDVVITNCPFSIARSDFLPLIFGLKKDFLLIGDLMWASWEPLLKKFMDGSVSFGYNQIHSFLMPDKNIKKFGNKYWLTNIPLNKERVPLSMTAKYDPRLHPTFYNCDAIFVDRLEHIPYDYTGIMAVPVTYLLRHCPEQFEILGVGNKHWADKIGIRPMGREWIDAYFESGQTGNFTAAMRNPVLMEKGKNPVCPFYRIFITNRYKA